MKKIILSTLTLFGLLFNANCNTSQLEDTEQLLTDSVELSNVKEEININKLIDALIFVESSGNPNAVSKDSTCIGVLQIKKIVVDDCNEYLTKLKKTPKFCYNDRYNKEKSIEMFHLIQKRYENFKTSRSKTKIEHMIRLWNGGCGYNITTTQPYYEKVIKLYNESI
jgi:hypothetical protein